MDTPTTDSLNVDEIKSELDSITPETTKEDLYKKIDFFVKQLNLAYDINKKNVMVLTEALEQAQTKYKKLEQYKNSRRARIKLALKKVLIGLGWYEASYDELKEIHEGRIVK